MTTITVMLDENFYELKVKDETDAEEIMEAALEAAGNDYTLAAKIWKIAVNGGENWIELD